MEKQTILNKSCTFKHVTKRWVQVKASACSEILTWKTNQLDKTWSRGRAEHDKTTAATRVIWFDVRSMKRLEARFARKWSVQFYAISSDSEEANVGRICDKTGQVSDIRAAAMLTILALLLLLPNTKGISTTDSPWILSSSTLPPSRTMPSLGNGQLAFVPFSDTITVNCLYNGDSWNSHRARVPNYANYVLGGEEPISSEYKWGLVNKPNKPADSDWTCDKLHGVQLIHSEGGQLRFCRFLVVYTLRFLSQLRNLRWRIGDTQARCWLSCPAPSPVRYVLKIHFFIEFGL